MQVAGGQTRNLTFNVWDFAGQEVYYMSHQLFLSERALYLVVWDVRSDFDSAVNNVGFWLSSIAARAGRDVPIVIVATHIDFPQCTDEYVNANMLRLSSTYGPLYPNIKSYRAVSTTKGDGIDSLLANVAQVALTIPGVGAAVPASYLALDEVMSSDGGGGGGGEAAASSQSSSSASTSTRAAGACRRCTGTSGRRSPSSAALPTTSSCDARRASCTASARLCILRPTTSSAIW
jgi:hypothetical protein